MRVLYLWIAWNRLHSCTKIDGQLGWPIHVYEENHAEDIETCEKLCEKDSGCDLIAFVDQKCYLENFEVNSFETQIPSISKADLAYKSSKNVKPWLAKF